MRGADEPVCGAAHLTLPSLRDGPLVSLGCGLMGCGWGVKRITPNRDAAETAGPLSRKAREGARLPRRHLRKPEQLPGIASRTCKAGTRKMADIVITAGIDVSKDRLDLALWPEPGANGSFTPGEIEPLISWLGAHRVSRIGLEASGGYEREVVRRLSAAGFVVVVANPLRVRRLPGSNGASSSSIDASPRWSPSSRTGKRWPSNCAACPGWDRCWPIP